MKIIKKLAVLSAAITAMAAFAMPSMASASVWGPLNSSQALDAVSPQYNAYVSPGFTWSCNGQHLATQVRGPKLDVTSATWTGCYLPGALSCTVSIATTGLPWTVTGAIPSVSVTMHAVMTIGPAGCPWAGTFGIDGTTTGTWSASTHTVTFTNATGLTLSYGGTPVSGILLTGPFRNPSQLLTLT